MTTISTTITAITAVRGETVITTGIEIEITIETGIATGAEITIEIVIMTAIPVRHRSAIPVLHHPAFHSR